MITGETDVTEMNGNIKLKLLGADDASSALPGYIKSFTTGTIRYM